MEAAGEAESLIDKIKPPRLEDAGLEDCALPPESIKEAFLKAASAVRSIVKDSYDEDEDEGRCADALVGITVGVTEPSDGCVVVKGGGSMEAPGDLVGGGGDAEGRTDLVVGGNLPEGGGVCVDGLQGLEIGGNGRGTLGKKEYEKDDVLDEEKGEDAPTLVEGYM